ncbi:MAG: hypothetical protein DME98_05285 [Verrucomicrobia bacterium]|nr:MAG: hypothetical protein DME98_05285 [Verrucomicrobiota bacterium]
MDNPPAIPATMATSQEACRKVRASNANASAMPNSPTMSDADNPVCELKIAHASQARLAASRKRAFLTDSRPSC